MSTKEQVGDFIKKVREEKEYSQSEFAFKLGIYRTQLIAYEKGTKVPSAEFLFRMAEAFNGTVRMIWNETQD